MRVSHESFGPEAVPAARAFIKRGLVFDPLKRSTAAELATHAWLGVFRAEPDEPPPEGAPSERAEPQEEQTPRVEEPSEVS
eukprot:6580408-Prymnesium_polylepis.2